MWGLYMTISDSGAVFGLRQGALQVADCAPSGLQAQPARQARAARSRLHLVDVTLFYGPETNGIKTYLCAKRHWLPERSAMRHTLLVPSHAWNGLHEPAPGPREGDVVPMRSVMLPFGRRYPLPVSSHESLLRALQPDVIEVGDPYHLAWSALRVGRDLNVPVIGFYHCDLPRVMDKRLGKTARRLADGYVARLYSRFDLVLAPSRAMEQRLRELGIERVCHQPLGVDTQVFHPSRRVPRLRTQLGLSPDARLLIYVGRFTPEKNVGALVRAVERLGKPYHLLLVGSGSQPAAGRNVFFLPFEHDRMRLASLIASCDALIHPGDQETFGLIVLEAMACAIPVIGVAAGGVPELVDARSGVLVARAAPADLAEGIAALFDMDRCALGLHARRRVETQYCWARVVDQLVDHYERVAA